MGTEAGTTLTISDIDENVDLVDVDESTLGSNAFNKLNDIVVNLNRGDTYTLVALGQGGGDVPGALEYNSDQTYNSDGLIGALVSSSKPVVVNSGSLTGGFLIWWWKQKDYGADQLVDISKVGSKYIFKKGTGANGWENVLLVATTDNTSITINGNPITNGNKYFYKGINVRSGDPPLSTTTITAGQYFLIEGEMYDGNGNMYVETSQPVYAFQGISPGAEIKDYSLCLHLSVLAWGM